MNRPRSFNPDVRAHFHAEKVKKTVFKIGDSSAVHEVMSLGIIYWYYGTLTLRLGDNTAQTCVIGERVLGVRIYVMSSSIGSSRALWSVPI